MVYSVWVAPRLITSRMWPRQSRCGIRVVQNRITPLESALLRRHRVLPCFSRSSGALTTFKMNTCGFARRNPFRFRTYKKRGEGVHVWQNACDNTKNIEAGSRRARLPYSGTLRHRRASRKLSIRGVADILQIGDADFAGVETVASHFAEKRKESDSLA